MIEQKINEFFGDAESTDFGTGWRSGILSAFFGFLSFGSVLCLHFPQLLSSPELRPHYPMHTMRVLIQCLIVGANFSSTAKAIAYRWAKRLNSHSHEPASAANASGYLQVAVSKAREHTVLVYAACLLALPIQH
ncbi:MAG TPA: hypothetical protein VNO32_22975 [Candidatus Acidoferrum sp.]|nr:hypothetical protein [Candidatus Acidoferrum sp.]